MVILHTVDPEQLIVLELTPAEALALIIELGALMEIGNRQQFQLPSVQCQRLHDVLTQSFGVTIKRE